jgi:DNA-binding XRE family transcriptional regulator
VTETNVTPRALGNVIRKLRGNRSRRVIARAAHITETTLYNAELGRNRPNESTLHGIASALGVKVVDLYIRCQNEGTSKQ